MELSLNQLTEDGYGTLGDARFVLADTLVAAKVVRVWFDYVQRHLHLSDSGTNVWVTQLVRWTLPQRAHNL